MKKVNFFIEHQRITADCDVSYRCPHCGRSLFECNDKPCWYKGKVKTQCMCGNLLTFRWTPFGNSVHVEIPYDERISYCLFIIVIKSYIFQVHYSKARQFY